MTTQAIPASANHGKVNQGNIWKSIGAVLAGFIVVAAVSLGTDEVFHILKVYPPWGEPMRAPGANALALAYRIVYSVLGGYITAKLAPQNPVKHCCDSGIDRFGHKYSRSDCDAANASWPGMVSDWAGNYGIAV
jgi:hypothetical protein